MSVNTGINVSKVNAYAVVSVPIGVSASKVNAYAVVDVPIGVSVSKANAYAVVGVPIGVSASKATAYAVVATPNFNPPAWGITSMPGGVVGTGYTVAWDMPTSASPVTYAITSGSLPAGLNLTALTGNQAEITGTPTATGSRTFTITATNAYGSASETFTIAVIANSNAYVDQTTYPGPTGVVATFGGLNIIALPSDAQPNVRAPLSIEWDSQEVVASSSSPFTGQQQVYDWQTSWLEGQVSFPPMNRHSADAWAAFIQACRGMLNAFMFGDPKAVSPKGTPAGTPVVNGAGQIGYALATRGWTPSTNGLLFMGDYIQIGYRLYRVRDNVNSDSSGNATLTVWPNLRDQPADGTTIITSNCKGLFRLAANSGNKFSVTPASYGLAGFKIREAI